jgi:putative membrane protein
MKYSLPAVLVALSFSCLAVPAYAADAAMATAADKTFVHKVGLGGMFEVDSSKLAADKAQSQQVKDFAANEVTEHTQVGDKLKTVATEMGVEVPMQRDAKFQKMYDALNARSGAGFDKLYLSDMKAIHHTDGGLFAHEADTTKNPDMKAFATETVGIVKRHIAALKAMQ